MMNLRRITSSALSSLALTLAFATPSWAHSAPSPECQRTRAVIDIGSGSTKLKVARVDICLQKILAILGPEGATGTRRVNFKADLQRSPTREFSAEVIQKGLAAVTELKALALSLGATEVRGVATAAFREAANAPAVIAAFASEGGVTARIITQRDEALLGYAGAVGLSGAPREKIVVWDIGGGSQQITAAPEVGELLLFEGTYASEPMKRALIADIQGRDPLQVSSPNPVFPSDATHGLAHARRAAALVPASLHALLSAPDTVVLGIGGVHHISIRAQTAAPADTYTPELIARTLESKLGLPDELVGGGQFAPTEVSNLILVQGFMEELGIRQVTAVSATIADGALVMPQYWPKD